MNAELPSEAVRELRAIRKTATAIFAGMAVILGIAVYNQVRFWGLGTTIHDEHISHIETWKEVRDAIDRQNFDGTLIMALALTEKAPAFYYGHSYLGTIYLAKEDLNNAEKSYTRAYELFPSEENRKNLEAIRSRLGKPVEADR